MAPPRPARSAREALGEIPRRELGWLLAAIAVGITVRVAYVLVTQHQGLHGDELEYDIDGRFIAAGKWFWSIAPYGIPHASTWKAPGYLAWVGVWYLILGSSHLGVELVQVILLGPLTITLTWLLGRRLWGPRVAVAGACLVALYPFAWQYEARLYSESIATPLLLATLLVFLDRAPTRARAVPTGVLVGLSMLVRPTSGFLLAGVAVAWILAAGWRRGGALTVLTIAIVGLVIAPWTYRNYRVTGGFVPISMQDAAAYGTFNDNAAHDPVYPYLWRPEEARDAALFDPRHPLSDLELRATLIKRARTYIADHPFSVVQAFFWNGLSRLWDVRRPARALNEVPYEGRSRLLTVIGLVMYYALLPLALVGLWRSRTRRGLVLPLLAIALGASIVFTVDSGTRYRAPLEPVIVLLACSALLAPRAEPLAVREPRRVGDWIASAP